LTTARQRRKLRERPGRKLLGLDLGERRVGIAVSDDLGSISFPVGIVDLRHQTLEDVATLAREQGVDGIVAGLPTTLSGEEGFQAREARAMAEELASMVDVRIVFWDERLTSTIADRMIEAGGRKKKNRASGERDAVAASIMLQGYLDANPVRNE
jgi:putative holliday junction resolvase